MCFKESRLFAIAFFSVAPLFFTSSGIFNSVDAGVRGVPISLMLFALLPLLVFVKHDFFLMVNFFIYLMAVLLPAVFSVFVGQFDELFLVASYAAPMLIAYGVVVLNFKESSCFYGYLKWCVVVLIVFSLPWVVYQVPFFLANGRANGDFFKMFVIYQVWVSFPTVLAIGFCLTFISEIKFPTVARVIFLIGIIFTGAREPYALIVCFMLFRFFILGRASDLIYPIVLLVMLCILYFFGVFDFFIGYLDGSVISSKIHNMLSGQQDLSAGRLDVISHFSLSTVNPFLGTYYSTLVEVGSAHNQFVELYFRGGLVSMFIPVSILFYLIYFVLRSVDKQLACLLLSICITSFNINVPLRVPYTAIFFWVCFYYLLINARKYKNSIADGRQEQ